jgi:hypothetical protein
MKRTPAIATKIGNRPTRDGTSRRAIARFEPLSIFGINAESTALRSATTMTMTKRFFGIRDARYWLTKSGAIKIIKTLDDA